MRCVWLLGSGLGTDWYRSVTKLSPDPAEPRPNWSKSDWNDRDLYQSQCVPCEQTMWVPLTTTIPTGRSI